MRLREGAAAFVQFTRLFTKTQIDQDVTRLAAAVARAAYAWGVARNEAEH